MREAFESFKKRVEPFSYWEDPDDGEASISYYFINDGRAFEIFNAVPEAVHFDGNGHDWAFSADYFLDKNEHLSGIKKDIILDAESGCFFAYSYNVEAFQKFVLEFRKVFDSEEQTRQMKEIFENKDNIILERNKKKIEITINNFKAVAENHPDLILHKQVNDIDTYSFATNRFVVIEINQDPKAFHRIEFFKPALGKRAISIHYDDFDDEIRHFEKLYTSELAVLQVSTDMVNSEENSIERPNLFWNRIDISWRVEDQEEEINRLIQDIQQLQKDEIAVEKHDLIDGEEGYAKIIFPTREPIEDLPLLALSERFPDFNISFQSIAEHLSYLKHVTYSEGEIQNDLLHDHFERIQKQYNDIISRTDGMADIGKEGKLQPNDEWVVVPSSDDSLDNEIEKASKISLNPQELDLD